MLPAQPGSSTESDRPALTDKRIAEMLARDDEEAFNVLYERYFRTAVGVAHRYLRDPLSAEDVAQESFVALWTHRHRYRHELGSIRTWLMAITRHRAIDAARRAHLRPRITATLEDLAGLAAPDDVVVETEHRVSRRRTLNAIAALPAPQREVVGLSAYGGLTHAEIAGRTGAPLGTVKSRSRLAMAKLRLDLVA